jgi:hypothetical protein
MLLNAKLLGGGHTAYEIQSSDGRIYVAGRHEMKVYIFVKKYNLCRRQVIRISEAG